MESREKRKLISCREKEKLYQPVAWEDDSQCTRCTGYRAHRSAQVVRPHDNGPGMKEQERSPSRWGRMAREGVNEACRKGRAVQIP